MGTFDDLINQVDAFIRKYYKNLMIRGVLLFLVIFLSTFILVAGLEYIGRFNSFVRGLLFFSFVAINIYVLVKNFIIPLSKLYSFGKRIDRYQAAKIIGRFFPNVNDRLLNTLQLQNVAQNNPRNVELLKASVYQNAKKLSVFSFTSAVDYTENKRFLKYFLPLLLTFVLIGIFIPNMFSDSSERLFNYNATFVEEADFDFELLNDELLVEEGQSVELNVKITPKPGKSVPNRVYVESSEGRFLMKKSSSNDATYTFDKVANDIKFNFIGNGFRSKEYELQVAKRTSLGRLSAKIEYPKYLQRTNDEVNNPGDLIIPEGSQITWNGNTKNAKQLSVLMKDTTYLFDDNGFRISERFVKSDDVVFVLSSKQLNKNDSLFYMVEVVKDQYPNISINKESDSINTKKVYFSGNVSDDYGLSRLTFTYNIKKENGEEVNETQSVPGISGNKSPFSMAFDLSKLGLSLKDEVTYYFTVYDNDGVNGSKPTRSNVFKYAAPSSDELNKKREESKEKSKKEMEELARETREFNEQMKRLKKDVMDSKKSSWQQLKQVEQLKEQRKSLEQRMKDLNKEMKNSFEEKTELSPMDEDLLEKQKLIEEMMDEVMDDELKELLDQLEELMKNQDDEDMLEKMEDAEMDAEEMEKQLDRTMDMLKQLDVEERVEDLQKSLEELAKKQEELKNQQEDGLDNEEAKEKQEELNKEFDKAQENLEEMLEKNDELKRPMEFDGLKDDGEEVSDKMEKAKEDLEKSNDKKAGEKQEDASKKMQEMSSKMEAMMSQSKKEQNEEDMDAMRALLENLIQLSFDQEENMDDFKDVSIHDPYFVELGKAQRSIIDNTSPIEDSLRALADRVPKIASFIEKELSEINKNYQKIPSHIGEREKSQLGVKQQFVMTSFNNLALFLNEALQNMQQDMQSMMSGDGSCDKPGKGKKGQGKEGEMKGIKEMLKKQLEQMQKGDQPGGDKPGDKPGGLIPMNSKQAAKMAAQQGEMRKKLQEIRDELNKDGKGTGNEMNDLLKELEEQEKDLVNKKWDNELIERQQEILTRLLESEKAMKERGLDKERESNSGKNKDLGNQIEFLEYKKQKEKQIELLRTLDPSFSKYYKERANQYFLNMN
ncbi:MAG: hypothetical protein WED10_03870 [Brumimicrobium sp.]